MKILVHLTGGVHWLGGVQYTRNLINAINSLPRAQRPEIVLKIGKKNDELDFGREFSGHKNIVVDGPIVANSQNVSRKIDLVRRILHRFLGVKVPVNIMRADECSVAYPVKGPNVVGNPQNVYWIPDFQYKHFPAFFSEKEIGDRDKMYHKMLSEDGILVLSSHAAERDFLQFFPEFKDKSTRVLHFCSVIENASFSVTPEGVCGKYNLPEKFIYLPNQLWQHKGFETAFEAIGLLRDEGICLPLVSTGSKDDYRKSEYYNELEVILKRHGIEQQIIFLGMVPRQDQLQIFRRAAIVLQPSRFEGWSTSVEDARALGKEIILSDIEVHREQDPPNATFFRTGDSRDLAEKIKVTWTSAAPGPDVRRENEARAASKKRARKYAMDFLEIMKEAVDRRWVKNLSRAERSDELLKLAALHHLLPETLPSQSVGPRFSKFVRHRRELFHPVGQTRVEQVASTTGLKFRVNLGDHLGCDLYYGMFNEQSEYELFNALIKPGDSVVDVGANIGLYSLLGALKTGPLGKVVAFEPNQHALELLKDNIKLNDLDGKIDVQPICVGNRNGVTHFNESAQTSFSGIIDTGRAYVERVREVPIRKLDDILPAIGVGKLDFLKVDVEGTEADVLSGATLTLSKSDAIIELEISTKNNSSAEISQMLDCLTRLEQEMDYVAYCISKDHTKLIRFSRMREIFESGAVETRNNYFLARRSHNKTALIEATFERILPLMSTPRRFFAGPIHEKLSRRELKAMLWAERERGMLAIGRAETARRQIEQLSKEARSVQQ